MPDASVTTANAMKAKPRGWLSKVFGRHAPWWLRIARTTVLAFAGLMAVDGAVLPNMPGRHLTAGEETMLREVYKDSVPYNEMRIHQSALADAWLNVTGQTAVARGNVIFVERTPDKDDYSKTSDTYMQYAITHETGHVWQDRNGVMPGIVATFVHKISHMTGGDKHADYRYSVLEGKDLLEYNIEQQASIITEAHFSAKGLMPPIFNTDGKATEAQLKAGYEATLRKFRENPSYPRR